MIIITEYKKLLNCSCLRHSDSSRIFRNKLSNIEQDGLDEHEPAQLRHALTRLHFVEVLVGAARHADFIDADVFDEVVQRNLHVDVVARLVFGEVTFEDVIVVVTEKLN